MTSLHHKTIEYIKVIKANSANKLELLKPCMVKTPVVVKVSKEIQVKIGQGDGDTRW
jgi:hypothetical protein